MGVRGIAVSLAVLGLALVGVALFGLKQTSAQYSVHVGGLINPRGIAFGPAGSLYVAEAGAAGPTMPDIGPRSRRFRLGYTARVSRVDSQGKRETILADLPSLNNGEEELGATDVAFLDGTLYVLTAAGGYQLGEQAFDNVLLRVEAPGPPNLTSTVFNLTAFNLAQPSVSRQRDPARTDVVGGMPFGLAAFEGALYATDGNQEHVTRITPDGQARRVLEYPTSDHVLTGIAAGPDQALYVAEFGPAPHKENSARITRQALDGQTSAAAEGLANAIDVAFDAGGQLYVLEFGKPGVRVPRTGRVLRLEPDGGYSVVATELSFPTSMAFGPDGYLYVATGGYRTADGEGEIIKLRVGQESGQDGRASSTFVAASGIGLLALAGILALVRVRRRSVPGGRA
jgi:hypothetical protein